MANALTASGLALPQINTMDQFGQGVSGAQTAAINTQNLDTAKQKQYMDGLNTIAAGAAYATDPKTGQVDPTKWNEVVDSVAKSGADVGRFRDHPYLAPMLIKLSLTTQQQIANAQNDQEMEQKAQEFGLEVQKAMQGPAPTDDQKELTQINTERKAAGKPELGMEDFLQGKKKGGFQVTTNPDGTTTITEGDLPAGETQYDKTMGAANAKTFTDLQDASAKGTQTLSTLGKMKSLLSDDKVYTGIGADQVLQLQRAAQTLGLGDGVKDTESFNALAKQAALDTMGGSLGSGFSNADRDFVESQVPNLQNTKPGNLQLVDIQSKIAQRKIDIARLATKYADDHNGRLDYKWNSTLSDWAEKHPLFSDADKAKSSGSSAPSPTNPPIKDWTTYGFDQGAQ